VSLKEHEKLKVENLTRNEILSGLEEDQVDAILTVVHNHLGKVIDDTVKNVHDQYDQDIERLTGKKKPGGVKSYVHLEQVIKEMKDGSGDAAKLKEQIESLEAERDELKKKVKAGAGDEALKGQLEKLEQRVSDKEEELKGVRKQLKAEQEEWKAKLEAAESEKVGITIDHRLKTELAGLKLVGDDVMPEAVRKRFVQAELEAIRNEYEIEVNDDGGLVFRKDGHVVPNPENLGNPITALELLSKRLEPVLGGDGKTGGGTSGGGSRGAGRSVAGLRGARNQVEADGMIRKQLQEKGLAPGSAEFTEKHLELRKDYEVDSLPVK